MMLKPKRLRRQAVIPTTSMGDIAFLLIIFFILCSNFAKEGEIKLNLPSSLSVAEMKESLLSVSIDDNNQIFFKGEKVRDAEEVESRLSEELKDKTSSQARVVMFKCDYRVSNDVFEPILDAIARSGAVIAAMGEKAGGK